LAKVLPMSSKIDNSQKWIDRLGRHTHIRIFVIDILDGLNSINHRVIKDLLFPKSKDSPKKLFNNQQECEIKQ